jgi:hypothetical protein
MPTTTSSELTQTVEVTIPPTIRFTSPVDGQIFLRGQYASFSYDAVDSDGSVVEVAMYINGGIFFTNYPEGPGPNSFHIGVGNYERTMVFTAAATDNRGLTTTSSPLTINVVATNAPPRH